MQYKKIVLALMAAAGTQMAAADDVLMLDGVEITGQETKVHVAKIYGDELKFSGITLGDVLSGQAGIHTNQFGAGASAPVIHGQDSHRTAVLQNGAEVVDMSHTSPDHAVVVDATLSDSIDVIHGIDTLRFGTGITGAVVDVKDNKIPTSIPQKTATGNVGLRFNSVNQEKLAKAKVRVGLGSRLALNAQLLATHAHDYKVKRYEHKHDDKVEHLTSVPNTMANSMSASVGLAWLGENVHAGLAYSHRKDKYGLPGHSEEYHACHTHLGKSDGMELHCGHHGHDHHGHSHSHDEHEHHDPIVDLKSGRYDVYAQVKSPFVGVDNIKLTADYTNYQHDEVEGDKPLSFFRNNGKNARLELSHAPLAGFRGLVGVNYGQNTMSITGQEALVRENDTQRFGVFATERFNWQDVRVGLGGRLERVNIKSHDERMINFGGDKYGQTAYAFGADIDWQVNPQMTWSLGVSHQERVPNPIELYARGLHLASNTYEWGDEQYDRVMSGLKDKAYNEIVQQNGESKEAFQKRMGADKRLDKESSNNINVGFRFENDAWDYQIKAFYKNYGNYIYARTLDRLDNFRLVRYAQDTASFYGIDGRVSYQAAPEYSVEVFGDYVHGTIGTATAPRIPATRLGTRLLADFGHGVTGTAEYVHTFKQNRIADFEKPTLGHHAVNMMVNYQSSNGDYDVFFKANNLLNQPVYNHASFLSNIPQAGRGVSLGVNYKF